MPRIGVCPTNQGHHGRHGQPNPRGYRGDEQCVAKAQEAEGPQTGMARDAIQTGELVRLLPGPLRHARLGLGVAEIERTTNLPLRSARCWCRCRFYLSGCGGIILSIRRSAATALVDKMDRYLKLGRGLADHPKGQGLQRKARGQCCRCGPAAEGERPLPSNLVSVGIGDAAHGDSGEGAVQAVVAVVAQPVDEVGAILGQEEVFGNEEAPSAGGPLEA